MAATIHNLRPFQKGQSGNPEGRPPYPRAIRELLKAKRKEWTEELFNELHKLAFKAERDSDRIKAIEMLLAYTIGKPREVVDRNEDSEPQMLTLEHADELEAAARKIREQASK